MLVSAVALTVLRIVIDPTPAASELPVAAILDEVRAIWRPYVTIAIVSPSASMPSIPSLPYGPTVHLQFGDEELANGGGEPQALGWIHFVDGVPSPLITVSRARARLLLARSNWLGRPMSQWPTAVAREVLTRVLARTAAHEIGHFLLRSTTHRAQGLMRAQFAVQDFFDSRHERFRLTRVDEAQMARAAVTSVAALRPLDPFTSASQPGLNWE